jgi:hypothetical protein
VRTALEAWRAAWASRDITAYLASYGRGFVPPQGVSREAWERSRHAALARAADVTIDLGQPQVTVSGPDQATTVFTQTYRSARYQDRVRKTMQWRRVEGRWVVVSETSEALR